MKLYGFVVNGVTIYIEEERIEAATRKAVDLITATEKTLELGDFRFILDLNEETCKIIKR